MAAAALASPAGLATSTALSRSPRCMLNQNSEFAGSSLKLGSPLRKQKTRAPATITCFQRDWLRKDFSVIGFGLIGWIAPSSIPAIKGESLTGLFFQSIGNELSHWPTGPALTSPFWLWLVCWHFGLFLCLTFGQIGFKGRGEYF